MNESRNSWWVILTPKAFHPDYEVYEGTVFFCKDQETAEAVQKRQMEEEGEKAVVLGPSDRVVR